MLKRALVCCVFALVVSQPPAFAPDQGLVRGHAVHDPTLFRFRLSLAGGDTHASIVGHGAHLQQVGRYKPVQHA